MAKRSQQDSGEERVTAKLRPMMNLVARTPSHVSSSTSVSPGKRSYGSQDPWNSIDTKEERSARPDKGTDLFEASDHHYHDHFMESFSSASYSKWDDDHAWSSQEWKTEAATYERSDRPDKTSWKMIRKVRPGHEETLRDRSGRLDINSQEEARHQQFVVGNDEQHWNCLWNQDHSWIGWMIKCEKDRKEFPMLREMERNILWFGECLWL